MAFSVEEVKDPDNSDIVTFSTSGKFANSSSTNTFNGTSNAANKLTLTYTPRGSTTVFITTSGTTNLGSFNMSANAADSYALVNAPFSITGSLTSTWTTSNAIAVTISGTVTKAANGSYSGSLTVTFPTTSYSLDGVIFTLPSTTSPRGPKAPVATSRARPPTQGVRRQRVLTRLRPSSEIKVARGVRTPRATSLSCGDALDTPERASPQSATNDECGMMSDELKRGLRLHIHHSSFRIHH